MNNELYRIATFSKCSVKSTTVSHLQLAKWGFFHSGQSGEVVCFACRRNVPGWWVVDNPRERHRQDFPDCPFTTEDAAGNIPANISPRDRGTATVVTVTDGPHSVVESDQRSPLDALHDAAYERARKKGLVGNESGAQLDRSLPDSDTLRQEAERPRTSHDSSASAQADPAAVPMASAEVVYNRLDDPAPLVESSVAAGGRTTNESDRQIPVTSQNFATGGQVNVEEESAEARMCTPIVLEILDLGFPRYLVKSVIEHRLSTTGDDFPNAGSLLEALFQKLEAPEQHAMSASETGQNSSSAPSNSTH